MLFLKNIFNKSIRLYDTNSICLEAYYNDAISITINHTTALGTAKNIKTFGIVYVRIACNQLVFPCFRRSPQPKYQRNSSNGKTRRDKKPRMSPHIPVGVANMLPKAKYRISQYGPQKIIKNIVSHAFRKDPLFLAKKKACEGACQRSP